MNFLFSQLIWFICFISTIFCVLFYFYFKHCFKYWERRNVPFVKPIFPGGNIGKSLLGQESVFDRIQNIYETYKKQNCKYVGMYFMNGPVFMPIDVNLIQRMLIADFEYFTDRGADIEFKNPLENNLLLIRGEKWKILRAKLSPTLFSSGKLKLIFSTFFMPNTTNFLKNIEHCADGKTSIDIKVMFSNFSAETIASSTLGVECDLINNPKSEFATIINDMFKPSVFHIVRMFMEKGFQNPSNMFTFPFTMKQTEEAFVKIVSETIKFRKENKVISNDFLSKLLEIKDHTLALTDEEIIAHFFIFLVAGFETTSTIFSTTAIELAYNPEIQNRLRKELKENLDSDITKNTYEAITKLPYLDKVLKESLRKYPVLGVLNRKCVKDYNIPGTNVTIEKNTNIVISLLGLQRDEEFFPNPMEYNPDRWDKYDANNSPFAYMPFGNGPRICPGIRYAKLLLKVSLAGILQKYKFLPSYKTSRNLVYKKLLVTPVMTLRNGYFIRIAPLSDS